MSNPTVGFVSLGCPKALVDSERILTQLKLEGYDVVPTYEDADVVVVNTCGFIDSAKQESLDAISEAMAANGRVIVTGCMGNGADAERIKQAHPNILSISGAAQYEPVMAAVHEHVPPPKTHNPLIDLVPPQGIKLTPRHYAYLKISEGCNHRCTFCIIPSMRGDLVSRPDRRCNERSRAIGASWRKRVAGDFTRHFRLRRGCEISHWLLARTADQNAHAGIVRSTRFARRVDALALCLPVSACGRRNSLDGARKNPALSRYSLSARLTFGVESHEAPRARRKNTGAHSTLAQHLP
jgi:hypothetical protein